MGKNYGIYAGLVGDYDIFLYTREFDNEEEAYNHAYEMAIEKYVSDRTIEDIMEEDDVSKSRAEEIYDDEMEDNIEYFVVPYDDDDDDYEYLEDEEEVYSDDED